MNNETNTTAIAARQLEILIRTQTREWYGDEDHIGEEGYGRYKCKGSSDFVTKVNEADLMYFEDAIKAAFNAEYNVNGLFFRYEAREIEIYHKPGHITLNVEIEREG